MTKLRLKTKKNRRKAQHCQLEPRRASSYNAAKHTISTKSDNLWPSYCYLTISNLRSVCHLAFDRKWIMISRPMTLCPYILPKYWIW